ncbi:MAG: hypothetical protein HKN76_17055 [Saprospiraceae bacterium]|nr:hypothetical protein [Saprospiraceae bacterium]
MKFLPAIFLTLISVLEVAGNFALVRDQIREVPQQEIFPVNLSNCKFTNPLRDLVWLSKLHQSQPSMSIHEYQKGGHVYFKIFNCTKSSNRAYWYDCAGTYKGRTSQNDNDLANYIARGAKFRKSWFTTCLKLTVPAPLCLTIAQFVAPGQNQPFLKGSNVQVGIDSRFPGNIKYIDLYINGQFVRREVHNPYRWGSQRHVDHVLKGMSRGTYKLKAKIKDKCGGLKTITRTFRVV